MLHPNRGVWYTSNNIFFAQVFAFCCAIYKLILHASLYDVLRYKDVLDDGLSIGAIGKSWFRVCKKISDENRMTSLKTFLFDDAIHSVAWKSSHTYALFNMSQHELQSKFMVVGHKFNLHGTTKDTLAGWYWECKTFTGLFYSWFYSCLMFLDGLSFRFGFWTSLSGFFRW